MMYEWRGGRVPRDFFKARLWCWDCFTSEVPTGAALTKYRRQGGGNSSAKASRISLKTKQKKVQ